MADDDAFPGLNEVSTIHPDQEAHLADSAGQPLLSQSQSQPRQFLHGAGLPFSEVLSAGRGLPALADPDVTFRDLRP
jgi:hypothetical protein